MSKWLTVEFDLVFYRGGADDIARAVIIANWYRTKCINELGWSEGSTLTSLLRHLFGGLSEASVAAKKMPLLSSVGLDAGVQPVDLCDFAAVALILHDGEKGMVPRVFYKLWSFLKMPLDPEPDCYPNSKEMRRLQPRSLQRAQEAVKANHKQIMGNKGWDCLNGRNWAVTMVDARVSRTFLATCDRL